MTTFDEFLTGKTLGHYRDGYEHLYRIDLEKVNIILRDYMDNYNDLSTLGHYAKPDVFGYYIPSIETLVCEASYYFESLKNTESNLTVLFSDNLKKEILNKVEEAMWQHELIASQMSDAMVDAAYKELSVDSSMYKAFVNGQESLEINLTAYIINGHRRNLTNQDLYNYLIDPQKTVNELLNVCVSELVQQGTRAGVKEAVYQRYRAIHTKQGTFQKPLTAIDLLNGELAGTKTLWLHLQNGERKQVKNVHHLSGNDIRIGDYTDQYSINDVHTIEYSRKLYPLTSA